jgi:uncharacterized membrane protein YkvA (DUF1232 family)
MRISLELEPADIERFHAALARARRASACADEYEVIEAAKYALDHLNTADVPSFVRKRVVEVQKLIVMLEDETWALSGAERDDIVETLVYFSDPDDLIPDEVEVIGLLDDAILLELLLQRMRHVRKAYAQFCAFRSALASDQRDVEARRAHARDLAALRTQVQARMRRARRAGLGPSGCVVGADA